MSTAPKDKKPSDDHPDLTGYSADLRSYGEDHEDELPLAVSAKVVISSLAFWAVLAAVVGTAAYWWLA